MSCARASMHAEAAMSANLILPTGSASKVSPSITSETNAVSSISQEELQATVQDSTTAIIRSGNMRSLLKILSLSDPNSGFPWKLICKAILLRLV